MPRRGRRSPPNALLAEYDEVRTQKKAAIAEQEFARAAELRERERDLKNQTLAAAEGRQDRMLAEMRSRLGLSEE